MPHTETLFQQVSSDTASSGAAPSADHEPAFVAASELRDRGLQRVAGVANDAALSREQLIDHIHTLNPTAAIGYLESFDNTALVQYLERLMRQAEPRSAGSTWVRSSGEPAITISMA